MAKYTVEINEVKEGSGCGGCLLVMIVVVILIALAKSQG